MLLVDLLHLNIISSVGEGRRDFLCVGVGSRFYDLYMHFHAGREINFVFIPEYFVKFQGVGTVILPADAEPHNGFEGFAAFGLVHAFTFCNGYHTSPCICDPELTFPETRTVRRLTEGQAGRKQ